MKYSSLIFLLFLVTSCYSYEIFPKEYRNFEYRGEQQLAFVANSWLKKENGILRRSGIFDLTPDSTRPDCVVIKLHPTRKSFACGQPILVSAFTLGQLPVYFQDTYYYRFEIIKNGDTTLKSLDLKVFERYWFWDMFLFNKNFSKAAGKVYMPITIRGMVLRRGYKLLKLSAFTLQELSVPNKPFL